jgi:hypothetical protein
MTQKNRADLTTEIATLIADAPAANISALDVRTTLLNAKDSNLNILSDTSDVITEGATKLLLTTTERTKIAREWRAQIYTTGVNYTPNITTALTHAFTPPGADKDFVKVYFEGVVQSQNSWSVAGAVITFTSPIPVGVDFVEISVLA